MSADGRVAKSGISRERATLVLCASASALYAAWRYYKSKRLASPSPPSSKAARKVPGLSELPRSSSMEIIHHCIDRQRQTMWVENDWDATLDKEILTDYVNIRVLKAKELWSLPSSLRAPAFIRWKREDASRGRPEWVVPKGDGQAYPADKPRLLFIHGGAYAWYSPKDYRPITTRLADVLNMPVLVIDYRLVPEHPYPAAIEDAVNACHYIASTGPNGEKPDSKSKGFPFFIMGDSSGGGLVYSAVLRMKESSPGRQLLSECVQGLITFSPWVDLTASQTSFVTKTWDGKTKTGDVQFSYGDPEKDREGTIGMARRYMGNDNIALDELKARSPLFAKDLTGIPPSLVMVGDEELSRDESVELVRALKSSGNEAEILVFPHMWHVWIWNTEGCGGEGARPLNEALAAFIAAAAFCGVQNSGKDSKYLSRFKL